MDEVDVCPHCGERVGRVELRGGEQSGVRYWHTDLVDVKEFCFVPVEGRPERVRRQTVPSE